MNSVFTVIKFTFLQRVRQRSFLISTLIFILLITLAGQLPTIIKKFSSSEAAVIGMVKETSGAAERMKAFYESQEQPSVRIKLLQDQGNPAANERAAREQIADGTIKGYLQSTGASAGELSSFSYIAKDVQNSDIRTALQNGIQTAKQQIEAEKLGLKSEQLAKMFAPVTIDAQQIAADGGNAAGKSDSQLKLAYGLVYALLLLLYIGVIGYGNLVATEITAEKSSRVMELLVSSVSPLKQMFGKIIGICLLGLLQIVIFIAVGLSNVYISDNRKLLEQFHLNLNELDLSLIAYFAIFYVLGYLIYATIFAAVGSLVSRTEEVGQMIMPITMLIVAAFMFAMYGLTNPMAPIIKIMSFVPFFTPLLMFERIGMTSPAAWEIVLSIGIMIVSIGLLAWMAAKIYRVGVLMYGKRPSWKELRKALKAYDV